MPAQAAAAVRDPALPPPAGGRPRWSGRLCKSGAPQCEVVCKECSLVAPLPATGVPSAAEPDSWPAELNMTARAVTQVCSVRMSIHEWDKMKTKLGFAALGSGSR